MPSSSAPLCILHGAQASGGQPGSSGWPMRALPLTCDPVSEPLAFSASGLVVFSFVCQQLVTSRQFFCLSFHILGPSCKGHSLDVQDYRHSKATSQQRARGALPSGGCRHTQLGVSCKPPHAVLDLAECAGWFAPKSGAGVHATQAGPEGKGYLQRTAGPGNGRWG